MDVEKVLIHYIAAAIWSSIDDNNEPLDGNYDQFDLSAACVEGMRQSVTDFVSQCKKLGLLEKYDGTPEQFGHDFWLTRNGHGVGFWDRGLGDLGDKLTDVAKSYGNCDLYVGDDGLIYC